MLKGMHQMLEKIVQRQEQEPEQDIESCADKEDLVALENQLQDRGFYNSMVHFVHISSPYFIYMYRYL